MLKRLHSRRHALHAIILPLFAVGTATLIVAAWSCVRTPTLVMRIGKAKWLGLSIQRGNLAVAGHRLEELSDQQLLDTYAPSHLRNNSDVARQLRTLDVPDLGNSATSIEEQIRNEMVLFHTDYSTWIHFGRIDVAQPYKQLGTRLHCFDPVVTFPLWPLGAGLLCIATAFGINTRRRCSEVGICAICGYNLMGNTSGLCSECGSACHGVRRR